MKNVESTNSRIKKSRKKTRKVFFLFYFISFGVSDCITMHENWIETSSTDVRNVATSLIYFDIHKLCFKSMTNHLYSLHIVKISVHQQNGNNGNHKQAHQYTSSHEYIATPSPNWIKLVGFTTVACVYVYVWVCAQSL